MKSRYEPLGKFIRQVDVRNKDLEITNLLGVSIEKRFMPSIANIVGTDLSNYKIVKNGEFAYGPVTSRNGEKISIALLGGEGCIISSSYTVFGVTKKDEIIPEYLMLWFMRPEFDRYARYKSHGSVREIFDWEEMCNVMLPVPPIERQRKIVTAYKTITDRIALKQRINDNLEATAQAVFEEMFANYYERQSLPQGWKRVRLDNLCSVKGGKRLPADCKLSSTPTKHPYIRIRDVGNGKYVSLTKQFQYVDDETYPAISRYTVNTDDIVMSIVGTIGLIGKIHSSLDNANLTENCVKLTTIHTVSSDYLYHTLIFKRMTNEIELLTVGAVQAKLPIYNIQTMQIIVPPASELMKFQQRIDAVNRQNMANAVEMQELYKLGDILLSRLSQ